MRRAWFLPMVVVLGGSCSSSDSGGHVHSEPHGTPIGIEQVEQNARGSFIDELGNPNLILGIECRPGEDGRGVEPNVHFRCEIDVADGESLSRALHLLERDQLVFYE
jgi:hypothetical protein